VAGPKGKPEGQAKEKEYPCDFLGFRSKELLCVSATLRLSPLFSTRSTENFVT